MSPATQNKATARRWFLDIIVQGKLDVADEIFAPDHQTHDPHAPPGGWANGPESLKMIAGPFHAAFPDLKVNIDDQIAEDDKVVTRWTARGTNTGAMRDVPPTGKSVVVTGANIARLANGQIVESWFNFDMLTLFRQLGLIPAPPQ
ncbi:MAG: ester cyclase [Myxococcales bacterium]